TPGMTSTPLAPSRYAVAPFTCFLKCSMAALTPALISPFVFAYATPETKESERVKHKANTITLRTLSIFIFPILLFCLCVFPDRHPHMHGQGKKTYILLPPESLLKVYHLRCSL